MERDGERGRLRVRNIYIRGRLEVTGLERERNRLWFRGVKREAEIGG